MTSDPESYGLQEDIRRLRKEVQRLRRDMRNEARFEERWRRVSAHMQPIMAAGLLFISLGVTMTATGANLVPHIGGWANLVLGLAVVALGLGAFSIPNQLNVFVLAKKPRLQRMMKALEDEDNVFAALQTWLGGEGDAGASLRRSIRNAERAFKLSLPGLIALGVAGVFAYLILLAAVVMRGSASPGFLTIAVLGGAIAVSVFAWSLYRLRTLQGKTIAPLRIHDGKDPMSAEPHLGRPRKRSRSTYSLWFATRQAHSVEDEALD